MNDKRIIVAGGFGTLGRAVVDKLTSLGAAAIVLDLASIPAGWSGEALGGVDISDPAAIESAIAKLENGAIDGLVNVAGGFIWETVTDGSIDSWDRLYAMNVRTTYAMTRAVLPQLKTSKGAIVNIGAASAIKATIGMGAYAASKSGVARLTEALAEELKDDGVRVNAVLPSIIDTPPNRADMPDADFDRWVKPSALADVIAFLLSDQAAAVTGALLPVTGRV